MKGLKHNKERNTAYIKQFRKSQVAVSSIDCRRQPKLLLSSPVGGAHQHVYTW